MEKTTILTILSLMIAFIAGTIGGYKLGYLGILLVIMGQLSIILASIAKEKKKDDAEREMIIKKLKFVARATLYNAPNVIKPEDIKIAESRAADVYWADDVI